MTGGVQGQNSRWGLGCPKNEEVVFLLEIANCSTCHSTRGTAPVLPSWQHHCLYIYLYSHKSANMSYFSRYLTDLFLSFCKGCKGTF